MNYDEQKLYQITIDLTKTKNKEEKNKLNKERTLLLKKLNIE